MFASNKRYLGTLDIECLGKTWTAGCYQIPRDWSDTEAQAEHGTSNEQDKLTGGHIRSGMPACSIMGRKHDDMEGT